MASASRRCPPSFNRGNAQRSPWPILTPLPRHPRSVGILPTFRQLAANLCQPADGINGKIFFYLPTNNAHPETMAQTSGKRRSVLRPVLRRPGEGGSLAEAEASVSRFTFHAPCHLRIAPFLHRFCTDFRKCISLLPVPQPLAKSDLKNGAILGLSRRSPWRSRIDIACRADLLRRSISAKAGPPLKRLRRPAAGPPRRPHAGRIGISVN